jgi:hypothetical protein
MVLLVLLYLGSRVFYFLQGIRYDVAPLDYYMQFIDPLLLRTRLLESVYYLHSQPPLFNLFLGGILHLFPHHYALAFHILFVGMGLVLAVSMLALGTRLGVLPWVSFALVLLFVISPPAILYENWLYYTYPIAMLLCLSGLFLNNFLRKGRWRDALAFFGVLALVVLTWSLFHVAWLLVPIVLLLLLGPNRHVALVSFSIPFVVCLTLYLKNFVVFGTFGSSSWIGMSLARVTIGALPNEEVQALVSDGTVSSLAVIAPYSPVKAYRFVARLAAIERTGIPVLDKEMKSTGFINYNNLRYVGISEQYQRDALRVLRVRPRVLLLSLRESVYHFSRPASEYVFLESNAAKIPKIDRFFDVFLYGQVRERDLAGALGPLKRQILEGGWFIVAAYVVAIVGGGTLLWQRLRARKLRRPSAVTLLFLWSTVIYVTAVGTILEIGENNRFRFVIDPLVLAMVGLVATEWWRRRRLKRRRPRNAVEEHPFASSPASLGPGESELPVRKRGHPLSNGPGDG